MNCRPEWLRGKLFEFFVPAMVILAIWSIFLGYNAYQAWRTYDVVSLHSMSILTPVVKVGEKLVYMNEYTKYLPLVPVITRELVAEDGMTRFSLSPTWLGDARVGHIINKRSVIIPDEIPPNKYRLSMTWTYHPNPQHAPVSYHALSEPFEVRGNRVTR